MALDRGTGIGRRPGIIWAPPARNTADGCVSVALPRRLILPPYGGMTGQQQDACLCPWLYSGPPGVPDGGPGRGGDSVQGGDRGCLRRAWGVGFAHAARR